MSIRRCLVLALVLMSCKPKEKAAVPTSKPFIVVGRYDDADAKGIRFNWPGTQIRSRFKGDSIAVDLRDDGANELEWSVDGSPPVRFSTKGPRRVYPLATKLGPGEHELVLTKRTEAAVGTIQLFALQGDLVGTPPLPAGTRRMEMIGDSITAGYGILGKEASCPFSPETEDQGVAWGALAAKELSAVHATIAWSGIGLYRNWDKSLEWTMPRRRYNAALAEEHPNGWRHAEFPPDVIVLALGTNDFAGAGTDPGEPFLVTLEGFLRTLRTMHPKAPVVLATSPMLMGEPHAAQKRYFSRAIEHGGDARVSLLDVEARPEEGLGCDGHPNTVTHRRMAAMLVAHLKPLLGW